MIIISRGIKWEEWTPIKRRWKEGHFSPLQQMKTGVCSKPLPTCSCSVSVYSHFICFFFDFLLYLFLPFISHRALLPPSQPSPILLLRSLLHLLPWLERLITFLACALHFSAGSHADLWPPTERSGARPVTQLGRCGAAPLTSLNHPLPLTLLVAGCWSLSQQPGLHPGPGRAATCSFSSISVIYVALLLAASDFF